MPYIRISGTNVYYEKHGKGRHALFLHGAFYDLRVYQDAIGVISQRYRVFAPEFPGFGRSEKASGDLTIDSYVSFLHGFASRLGIRKPSIFAHSGSAPVAIEYALRFPAARLVLFAGSGIPYFRSAGEMLLSLGKKNLKALFIHPLRSVKMQINGTYNLLRYSSDARMWRFIRKNATSDHSKAIRQLDTDVTLVWGADDDVYPLSYAKRFRNMLKKGRLVKVTGGHDWPVLNPGEIRKVLFRGKP